MIPNGWELLSINQIAAAEKNSIVDGPFGSNLKLEHYRSTGIPVIQSGFVTSGKFAAKSYVYVEAELFEQQKRSKVECGDLVMAKIGAQAGKCAILPKGHPTSILAGNSLKITVNTSKYLTEFLRLQLAFNYELNGLQEIRNESAQPAISLSSLKSYKILFPPKNEQLAICECLMNWERSIDLTEHLIAAKQERRMWLMQQLLTGKHRAPGFSKKWGTKRMKDLVEPIQRPVPKPTDAYKALGIRSHCKGTFERLVSDPNTVDMDELFIAQKGDLIVNITFAWEGAIAFVPEEHDGNLVSHRFPTYKLKENEVDADFLRHVIIQPRFIFTLVLISPGGAGRNRVMSKRDFLDIELSVPCLEEQRRIGKILTLADEEIALLSKQRDALQEQKKGLMQQLLTGKVRVKI